MQWNNLLLNFIFLMRQHQKGFQGGTTYNWNEGRVKFSMGSNSVGSGILAHELRHGYGYLSGEMSGSRYDDPLYDMMDEVVAYKTASLFWE